LAAVRQEHAKHKVSLLRQPWVRQPWVYAAAVVVVSVFFTLNILSDAEKELSRQAVVRHSHSLSVDHLVDLASPNPAVIKPCLTARLDFAPPVVGARRLRGTPSLEDG
jgi:hypothetical protein